MQHERSLQELFSLAGRTALITGASGHLGGAMARALAEAGARVIVGSREQKRAEEAAAALPSVDGPHLGVALDHMDESSIHSGFDSAVARAGRVDVLVCNGHEVLSADWRNVSGEQFTRQLQNATGYFLLARKLRDHAVGRSAPASIIMLGSMYGLAGSYPEVYEGVGPASPAAYHALKGGILQLVRHLAVYWARDGVRVNALSPGAFPSGTAPGELVTRLEERCPMRRIGAPHELKGALVFLASDASSYVTGHNLVVDGGWTAW